MQIAILDTIQSITPQSSIRFTSSIKKPARHFDPKYLLGFFVVFGCPCLVVVKAEEVEEALRRRTGHQPKRPSPLPIMGKQTHRQLELRSGSKS